MQVRNLVALLAIASLLAAEENNTAGAAKAAAGTPAPAASAAAAQIITEPPPLGSSILPAMVGGTYDPYLDEPSFPSGNYFRKHFQFPSTKVELRPPVRLQDFVVGDKIELSLKNYIELVLANNTDVEIQRHSVDDERNNITRAFAPFDPILTGSFNNQRTKSPSSSVLDGANTLSTLNQPWNVGFQQTLTNSMQLNASYATTKTSTSSSFATFNPAVNSGLSVSFVQPLLRNRGTYITKLPITIARSRLRSAEYSVQDQIMRLLTQSENAYWDAIFNRENLRVREKALELNAEALKRSRRELELGAISPLDIYQPEANYASSEIQVSQARFSLQQTEDVLRKQIAVDLDPELRKLPIVLTEDVLPQDAREYDREELVQRALAKRPDLKAVYANLDVDELNIKTTQNALRPDISLRGNYQATGRGGTFYDRRNAFGQSTLVRVIPGGFNDSVDQLFGFGFPIYSFGLTMRLPIRDRRAAADFADAVLAKKRDTLAARSTAQQIRLDVLNAISQVESSRASVKLAIVNRDLAQKQLDAEQKKYDLGTSVIFFVLDAQTRLVNAESTLVTSSIQYRRNLLNMLRFTGDLLAERGVAVQ